MRARQCVRAEGAEGSGADCGAGAAGGDGVFAGAVAVRSLRAGVHGRGAGRSGAGEVRRDGGGDDRATQVRQRDPVLPAGTAGRATRDSAAGGDAVGDRGRGGGGDQAGAGRTDPAGGARGSAAQRRHRHEGAEAGARARRQAHRRLHQRHRFHGGGPEDRAVLHRAAARGREYRGCAEAAGRGVGRGDPDVRRVVVERAEAAGRGGNAGGPLPRPWTAADRRSGAELSRRVPARAGDSWARCTATMRRRATPA